MAIAELTPLTTWTCDTCSNQVTPEEGLVVARDGDHETDRMKGFQIVHKSIGGRACDPGAKGGHTVSFELTSMLGDQGQARLFGLLSAGPIKGDRGAVLVDDLDEFVDLFRRLQTPFYEEARPNFQRQEVEEEFGESNSIGPYLTSNLQRIAGVGRA